MASTLPENVHKRSHTLAPGCDPLPHAGSPALEELTSLTHPVGGKTEALPGRPRWAGLVHCVCESVRTLKARGPHVSPSATPTLTVLGHQWGDSFSLVMSTTMSTNSRGTVP